MKCHKVEKQLPLYIGNDLNRMQMDRIRRHVSSCPECRGMVRELQAARLKTVRAVQNRSVQFQNDNLWDEVLYKLPHRAVVPEPSKKSGFNLHKLVPGLVGAALVVMILFFNEGRNMVKTAPESLMPELPVVESVDEPGVTVMTFETDDPEVTIVWLFKDDLNL